MMCFRTQEHTSHNVRRAHSLCSGNALELFDLLDMSVHVLTVHNARIVTVYDVVDIIFLDNHVEIFRCHHVGYVRHDLLHETTRSYSRLTLLVRHTRCTSLTFRDTLVRVHTHNKFGSQAVPQTKRIHVTVMH